MMVRGSELCVDLARDAVVQAKAKMIRKRIAAAGGEVSQLDARTPYGDAVVPMRGAIDVNAASQLRLGYAARPR